MRFVFAVCRLLALVSLFPLAARATPVEFNLPAEPAAAALMKFSKQTKIDVLFSPADLRDARSADVIGLYEPEDALARLLKGSGFVAQQTGRGRFVVTAIARRTGSIKGRLVLPDSSPARGVRVIIAETRETTATNHAGEFTFSSIPPATYRVIATADGYVPLQINAATVAPDEALTLGVRTILKANDPERLAPFVVQDTSDRRMPFDYERDPNGPRLAAGNLDLRRTENGPLPYTVYNRSQIARSGVVNLNEFLQRELLDSDAATRPPEQDGTQPSFVAGSSNLSLRGYGADETVILVNGRRLPEVLTSGQGALPPDVNFIPLSLVQQVEVLPISASALYSGNPVGGVINIVLRPGDDVNATEVTATYTNTMAGFDAPQSSLSLMHTHNLLGGALRLRFNASFARSTPPTEAELGYHQGRAPPPAALEAGIFRATPYVRSTNLGPLFGPGTAPVTSVAPGADGNGGLAAFAGREGMPNLDFFKSTGGLAASLDSLDYPYGRRQRRNVFFGSALYDVARWLQIGVEGTFARTTINRGYDVFGADLTMRADARFNPFRRAIAVSLNETAPALGEDYSEAQLEFSSVALGFLVKLPADWRLALDGQYARNLSKYRGIAGADGARWQQLVDQGRYNPLRDTQAFGPPQDFYDEVLVYRGGRGRFVALGDFDTWDAAARATNESLKLPTGLSTLNLGVDYRRSHLAKFADERRFADNTLAETPIRWGGRTLRRYSAFGEVQFPLFPTSRLPSWLRSAEADVAVRYVASDSANEANIAPTYGLKVDFAGGFSFRGSLTTSSRFPTPNMSRLVVSSASGGTGVEPSLVYDPIRDQIYNVQTAEAINPDLRPEAAVTQTAGLMFRRGDKHRFRATLDLVDTRKVNELVFLDAKAILGLEPLWPERVQRAVIQSGDFRRAGLVTNVITGTVNLAWRRSQNWNTSLTYAWTECFKGTLELYGRLLYFQRYDRQIFPTSAVVDELAKPDGTAPGLLRYRANFGAGWANKNFGFGLDGHYFHPRILPEYEWSTQRSHEIGRFLQYDAYVQAELGHWMPWKFFRKGLRAQVRVNNVFGADFPAYTNEGSGAGVQPYGDWRGRVYSLSLTAAF
ncbi:MAG TPA: carboxypeptidase regulatory-like domain-containing protein [Opitutaceae bacterium]|nr:carboxypeptidase regulatory-like domain-containing protein [Opitutaceae bacterium]